MSLIHSKHCFRRHNTPHTTKTPQNPSVWRPKRCAQRRGGVGRFVFLSFSLLVASFTASKPFVCPPPCVTCARTPPLHTLCRCTVRSTAGGNECHGRPRGLEVQAPSQCRRREGPSEGCDVARRCPVWVQEIQCQKLCRVRFCSVGFAPCSVVRGAAYSCTNTPFLCLLTSSAAAVTIDNDLPPFDVDDLPPAAAPPGVDPRLVGGITFAPSGADTSPSSLARSAEELQTIRFIVMREDCLRGLRNKLRRVEARFDVTDELTDHLMVLRSVTCSACECIGEWKRQFAKVRKIVPVVLC